MRIDRLREIRNARQLSQQDLAERAGISLNQISRYERGESDPSVSHLTRIAKELGVSLDYLVGLVNEPQGHITAEELAPDERKLLAAYRRGDWPALMKVIVQGEKPEDQPGVPSV